MVKHLQGQNESLYGLPQPTVNQFPTPIVARRDPTTSDTGYILGQIWVNKVSGTFFGMASVGGGVATWLSLGGSLTPSVASITTGAAATSSLLNGNVWSATGTNAAISLTLTPKGTGDVVLTSGNLSVASGNVEMITAGKGLEIATGANARMGVSAALVGGTLAVANTSATANTRIFLTYNTPDIVAHQGSLSYVINAGVGFTINSSNAADTSTVNWLLIEAI